MYIYTFTLKCTYIEIHSSIHIYRDSFFHTHIYTYLHVLYNLQIQIYLYIYIYIIICIHIRTTYVQEAHVELQSHLRARPLSDELENFWRHGWSLRSPSGAWPQYSEPLWRRSHEGQGPLRQVFAQQVQTPRATARASVQRAAAPGSSTAAPVQSNALNSLQSVPYSNSSIGP